MTWLKHQKGDRWFLFADPAGGNTREALGAVERIGIAYEARNRDGIVIGKRCMRKHAMDLCEQAEKPSR